MVIWCKSSTNRQQEIIRIISIINSISYGVVGKFRIPYRPPELQKVPVTFKKRDTLVLASQKA